MDPATDKEMIRISKDIGKHALFKEIKNASLNVFISGSVSGIERRVTGDCDQVS